ncbi:alpha-galactosidase [Aureococcus anophagefferens]|nr:alpha-galactosidase [Aureococcus anophagefferens]
MHGPRLLCLVAVARGEFDTPMLGFNTCNVGCGNATFPNAAWLLRTADLLVARGFAAAGYTSVNLDEGWADLARDGDGNQVANEDRFPGGVRPVADALHARDLELGIYTSLSPETCGGKSAGSCGREARDGAAYVAWGVDYAALRGAAAAAGRETPVFFSTESAPNVTRMSERPDLYGNTGRGGFFLDCDMLQVGQGEFGDGRVEEIRSHVTMHAMLKSTLLVSTEVDRLSDDVVALLTNRELLAVHQDPLGAAARRVASEPPARPRAVFGNASDYALFAVMPCEPGNPRQRWELRGDGTLATTDEAGAAWCVGAGQWARPAEVLPCGKAPDAGACGCDVYEGCCHDVGSVRDGGDARVPRRLRDAGDRGRRVGDGRLVLGRRRASSRRRAWAARDGGAILDDDHVGTVRATPAADYCAEAVLSSGNLETWVAPLAGGRYAVALLNRSPAAEELTATWRALGLRGTYAVRDVWAGRDAGDRGILRATVRAKARSSCSRHATSTVLRGAVKGADPKLCDLGWTSD